MTNKKIAPALLCFILLVQTVSACSCAGPITTKSSYENHDVVFYGKIISTEETIKNEFSSSLKTNFEVIESFKGDDKKIISIYSEKSDGANCGYTFGTDETSYGREFLVFAYENEGRLETSSCSGNRPSDSAQEELNALRELSGKQVVEPPVEPEPTEPTPPKPETENKNFFQKTWLWLKNLFS